MRARVLLPAVALVLAACSGGDQPTVLGTEVPATSSAPLFADDVDDTVPDDAVPGDTGPDGSGSAPTTTDQPDRASAEPATWRDCDGYIGFDCATIQVPLDHADPTGRTIPIALIRRQATGADEDRIGSVVFNPGGPGGSGLEYLSLAVYGMPDAVAERFDLVSFDPRGVGASAAIDCDLPLDDDIWLVPDDDRATWDAFLAEQTEQMATCGSRPNGIAPYVGTNNAARDLDLIRAALGDELLTYVGFSYGTRLGATYAELFPDRIRALVLDGAVAPSTDFAALGADQGAGFDRALAAFAEACDADADCPLRVIGPTLDVVTAVRGAAREAGSLATDEPDRLLTPGELDLGIVSALYSQSAWPYLALALHDADTIGDGTLLQVLADLYLGRQLDGTYTNQSEAGTFINCADDAARPDIETIWAAADTTADGSDWFGELLRGSFGCIGTPDPIDPLVIGPATGAPPILVIGTTGDPATPYDWSVQLAGYLDSGVLYTVEGEGHTAYTSIDCVTDVVDAYLIDLEVPAEGSSCTDDTDPDDVFLPAGESEVERVLAFFACLGEQGAEVPHLTVADILRDPSGESLLEVVDFGDPATLVAVGACQSLLDF